MANIWLIIIFAVPILLILLLKVNAIYVYLSLCLGYTLSSFDGGSKLVTKLADNKSINLIGGASDTRLALLLIPVALVLIFMFRTAPGGKHSLNILPAIAAGLLAVLTVVPLLPLNDAVTIMNGSLWNHLSSYSSTIVGLSSLVVVLLFIFHRSKHGSKGFKHHKSKP